MEEPLVDRLFQFGGALEGSAADHSLRDQSEEPLHLIEPGTAGGSEMEVEAPAFLRLQPALHVSSLVGRIVVHDQMDLSI